METVKLAQSMRSNQVLGLATTGPLGRVMGALARGWRVVPPRVGTNFGGTGKIRIRPVHKLWNQQIQCEKKAHYRTMHSQTLNFFPFKISLSGFMCDMETIVARG